MDNPDRLTHAARVLRIREMLDARSFVTVAELQRTFGVSRRTVYNDIQALTDAGVPLFSEKGDDGQARWQLMPAARRRTLSLSVAQVLSLGLARRALSFLEGTDLHGELAAVFDRLVPGLAPANRRFAEQMQRKIAVVHHGPKSYGDRVDQLNDILTGLLYDDLLDLWYRPPGKKVRRHRVEPYTLLMHNEALYLICYSRTRKSHRTLAVDRITRTRWLKGQRFDYPDDYSPDAFLDGSFGLMGGDEARVEILFDEDAGAYIRERQWHPSQQLDTADDGRLRLRMEVHGTVELLNWLLGYGRSAEVTRPAGLRARVRRTLERALARHED
jgi:predicted DNA-binding transcriptional regulator YafY